MPINRSSSAYEGTRTLFRFDELVVGEEYFVSTGRSIKQLVPDNTIVKVLKKNTDPNDVYRRGNTVDVSYEDENGTEQTINLNIYDWDFTKNIVGDTNAGGRKTKKNNKRKKNKSKRKRATKHRRNKK